MEQIRKNDVSTIQSTRVFLLGGFKIIQEDWMMKKKTKNKSSQGLQHTPMVVL